ncbi:peptidylprolyl isomerase [bacterium]|nr:peptidylprolyl isomerase [bacterium]
MFSYLRARMKAVFLVTAIAFLFTIFAFWGMDIDSSQFGASVAFTVNGDDIPIRDYENLVSRYLDQYKGQEVTEGLRRQIRKQAADEMIGRKILEQTAEKMGIYMTKEELQGHVRQAFPSDEVYNSYLVQAPAAWWQNLEESTERDILVSRARSPFSDGVWVSDSEWAKIVNDLYYEADISHILFTPSAEVSETDVRRYYDANTLRIQEPTRIRARQVLLKVPDGAPDTEAVAAGERIKKIHELAKAGKDFPALARRFSEAPDAEDGGDMGFYKSGDMINSVEDVTFKLQPGEISDPVRTEFGYHVFKLEERIPAHVRPWSEDLIRELVPHSVTDTHWGMARERAGRVLEAIQKFPDQFSLLAGLHSQGASGKDGGHLGWMPRLIFPSGYDPLPLIGEVTNGTAIDRDISYTAFAAPVGEVVSEPVKSSFGWHILKVNGRRRIVAHSPTDTDVQIVQSTYLRLLREETLIRWVQEERKRAKVKYNIDVES